MIAIFILTLCFGHKHSLFHAFFPPYPFPMLEVKHILVITKKKKRKIISDDDANIKSINEENLSKFCNTKKIKIETK